MLSRSEFIGPWAGLPVAWNQDWTFDEKAYRQNVVTVCQAGVPGIYTGGTTGEFYAMEFDEFKQVSLATAEECRARKTPCMIGVTSTYTLGAQRRAEYAAKLGADAIQLALPFWMELTGPEILSFVRDVASACPGLALSIYETTRAKNCLTLEQHRLIHDEVPAYLGVKSTAGTLGATPAGCAALSDFVNVWVSEHRWHELGPFGAIGCASALVYLNPKVILHMFDLLRKKDWDRLKPWTDRVKKFTSEGLCPFTEKGFQDSAYDHMLGLVAGFLAMSPRSRPPYTSATPDDIQQLRSWLDINLPEFLQLDAPVEEK
jgi:4-hydroxy-tetrahydrodipicolinate synthase